MRVNTINTINRNINYPSISEEIDRLTIEHSNIQLDDNSLNLINSINTNTEVLESSNISLTSTIESNIENIAIVITNCNINQTFLQNTLFLLKNSNLVFFSIFSGVIIISGCFIYNYSLKFKFREQLQNTNNINISNNEITTKVKVIKSFLIWIINKL